MVPSPGAGEFVNPVLKGNFADPQVINVDGTFYAYATGNLTYNIQVSTSPDLVHWSPPEEALPRLPLWQPSSKGLSWAPEVMRFGDAFVMYYTGREVLKGKQCVTFAVSDSPTGPFVDESSEPLVCQYEIGGTIDSSPFTDSDGKHYLLYKNDGNCCGFKTRIYIQQLSADGQKLVGEATETGENNDRGWERNLVEGPNLVLHDGTYFLFYSANDYNSRNYAAGYATSKKVRGPYVDGKENPILVSKASAAGPGGQTVVADKDGDLWMLYHAWDSKRIGDFNNGERSMWLDELVFSGSTVSVDGPEVGPQPIP